MIGKFYAIHKFDHGIHYYWDFHNRAWCVRFDQYTLLRVCNEADQNMFDMHVKQAKGGTVKRYGFTEEK